MINQLLYIMFDSYPIHISTQAYSEASLLEQINSLKQIARLGVEWELFHAVVINAHNGTTSQMRFRPEERNSSDFKGWVQHYARYQITVNENQIESIFNYIIIYHSGILQAANNIYTLVSSPRDMEMKFEFVIFKALE